MFLVGMGADEDIYEMLSLNEEQYARVRVIVMDSHRPLHLRNTDVNDGDRLAVLVDPRDGATDVDALPAPSAGTTPGFVLCVWTHTGTHTHTGSSSDSEDDSEGVDDEGINQRRARKRCVQ